MFKFKDTMIAAAALAVMAAPTVASAGKYSDKIHLIRELQDAKRLQVLQLKVDYKNGDTHLTHAEYHAKLARLQASLDKLGDRIQAIKDKRASA